jgi:saccharopine dehydrogenase-like NADP-dependent oxidoreductase
MAKILVLGAGMVAGPLVRYLLEAGARVTVTSLEAAEAERLVGGHQAGEARAFDLADDAGLSALVGAHDLVVSLVPYAFHPKVAGHCLRHGRHLVTASYVAPAMQELDGAARAQGLTFLNELGLDPGIDHMSAMRVIDAVAAEGGHLGSFRSYCGGLPAPDANDNPLGYKFSWAPRGVLMACRNAARYRREGRDVAVPPDRLFRDMHLLHVPGAGDFEAYPNRDSLVYREAYGLPADIETLFRGTLRNIGWCDTLHAFGRLGLLDDQPREGGTTRGAYVRSLLGAAAGADVRAAATAKLGQADGCLPAANLAWLGLGDETPLPAGPRSPLDVLGDAMLEKLCYRPGERDMVVMFHEFLWKTAAGAGRRTTSRLVACGERNGDSAMARTVSLPAAVAARLVLEGSISVRGVLRPVVPEIYDPVLHELESLGIECLEETEDC